MQAPKQKPQTLSYMGVHTNTRTAKAKKGKKKIETAPVQQSKEEVYEKSDVDLMAYGMLMTEVEGY